MAIRMILAGAALLAALALSACGGGVAEPAAPAADATPHQRRPDARPGAARASKARPESARARRKAAGHRRAARGRRRAAGAARERRRARTADATRSPARKPRTRTRRATERSGATRRPRAPRAARRPSVKPLSAEGKDQIEAVKGALLRLLRAFADHDPAACTELLTPRALQESTGKTGQAAVEQCRRDVAADGPSPRLNDVEGVRVAGTTAWIQFTSSVGAYAKRQVLRFRSVEGRWLMDGDGTADVQGSPLGS